MSFLTNLAEDQEMTILSKITRPPLESCSDSLCFSSSGIPPRGQSSLARNRRSSRLAWKVQSLLGGCLERWLVWQRLVCRLPELDVWHPINGRRWAKREESGSCQLAMGGTSTSTTTSTTIQRPLSDRPPPSVLARPIDGGNGGDLQLIR